LVQACVAIAVLSIACDTHAQSSESASAAERLERLERAVQLLEKRNAELEQEVSALKQDKAAPRQPKQTAETPAKPAAEPSDAKTVVAKTETKEEKKTVPVFAAASELKLTLGGFIQTQVEAGDVFAFEGRFGTGPNEVKDRFRIRRARLNVTGDYAEQFDFKLEGEFAQSDVALTVRDASGRTLASNATRTNFGGTDLFANWHLFPEANVKVGQYKAPFGLEQLTSDTKLFTLERSLATTALTPERQIGVQVWGKPFANIWPEQKELLSYSIGVFNGTGRNISVNDNNEFMYVGRLELMAMKTKILNQDATLKVGANGLTSRDDAGTTVSGVIRENSDGSLASFSLPTAGQRDGYGFDAALHIGPFDLIGEYLDERLRPRRVAGVTPGFTEFEPDGYYIQGSYFVLPKKLQLIAKWESFNPDQFLDDDIHSFTAGVNYYLKGDDLKVLAHYTHTWSDFRDTRPAIGDADFDQIIVRLQVLF
jgi:phosphate-selective porin